MDNKHFIASSSQFKEELMKNIKSANKMQLTALLNAYNRQDIIGIGFEIIKIYNKLDAASYLSDVETPSRYLSPKRS